MKLYAAICHETDNYTYSCDIVLGIFSTRPLADEAILKDFEKGQRDLEDYTNREIEVDSLWE